MPKYNPFRPGSIVTPGMFSGRVDELVKLESILFQTRFGNPQHFLIQGERGIGKSSLLFYLQSVADGSISPLEGSRCNFLTVALELEPSHSYTELIRRVGAAFQRRVAGFSPAKTLAKEIWDFIKRWEVLGVKYSAEAGDPEPHVLLDELSHTVSATMLGLANVIDGAIFLLDEADRPHSKAHVGEFAKVFTEKLTKAGCNNVCLGLAGVTGIIEKLKQSHSSSPRIFEILTLDPLLESERARVIRKGLDDAKGKTGVETTIKPEAEALICELSEGYPHFIQQYAFSAFDQASGDVIEIEDVTRGAVGENGALAQLGHKYFEALYFEKIGSDEYRAVLNAMAEHFDEWVSKADLRRAANVKTSTLDNAISALKTRHIIIPRPGKQGVYKLPTRSFAVWIRAYCQTQRLRATQGLDAPADGPG